MLPIDPRKGKVLAAIVQHFIETAEPVGSKTVLVNYNMQVSPATIRNDMAFLENEGFIFQPHTSAGRIPTTQGYRLYLDELADYKRAEKLALENLKRLQKDIAQERAQQKVNDAVNLLSRAVPNLSFATIPGNTRTFFLGTSNILN